MVTISITAEAYAAIRSTLPKGVRAQRGLTRAAVSRSDKRPVWVELRDLILEPNPAGALAVEQMA
jgi:hypothetical protein